MRVMSVYGTRPEAIKMAPVVLALAADPRFEASVCVTGQHREMLESVNNLFGIVPDIDLKIMRSGQGLAYVTTAVLEGMERVLAEHRPDMILVHGDTTTSMAAALASFYAGVRVGHVEAGLRTHNLQSPWPEEANRQITGRLTDIHFAPTRLARENLLAENVPDARIVVTGNTVIDALLASKSQIEGDSTLERDLAAQFPFLDPTKRLVLVTGHRRENHAGGIASVCRALAQIARRGDVQVVYSVHLNPKVVEAANKELRGIDNVYLIEPVAYLAFTFLLMQCYLVITDSGGIQEEAPSLGKPVLVTRSTTERPEAIDAGTVKLLGTDTANLLAEVLHLFDDDRAYAAMANATNPYGDGKAAPRILDALANMDKAG